MSKEQFFSLSGPTFAEGRRSTNSGRHYKLHMHRTFSIGAVDCGEVLYQVAGQEARLGPGTLALINPDTLHSCNPVGHEKRNYYMLYLDVNWCRQVQTSIWQSTKFIQVKETSLDNERIYRQYIDTMELLAKNNKQPVREARLTELVQTIFLRTCEPTISLSDPPLQIERLKQQLGSNLAHHLTLEQLAATHRINPYTLLRQFKAATGITPHAFRLNCRIDLAKKILRAGIEPSVAALECGFFDQSHLHRHFKAMTTVTPKEYQVNFT